MNSCKSHLGFSLIEVIIAIALFAIFATGLMGLLFASYGSDLQAKERDLAVLYAQEGIDAALSIRRQAWNFLTNGNHGLTTTNGYWEFSGSSEDIDGTYTRVIAVEDGCRNGSGDIVDCGEAGASVDLNTKKITSSVNYISSTLIGNQVDLVAYATNWQSKEWLQTDWSAGSGQATWFNPARYQSDDGNVDISTAGQVSLAFSAGSSCGINTWDFNDQSNYSFDDTKIEFSTLGGGETVAQLIYSGGGDSGGTVNPDFDVDTANWTFSDWEDVGNRVNGIFQSSGGNPNGYVNIAIDKQRNASLSGYWEQSFTTTADNPSIATVDFDWLVSQYDASFVSSFQLYVFVDTVSGAPTLGQQVWSSGEISGTSSWAGVSGVDISSRLGSAGTYYLKVVSRVVTVGGVGPATGTNTVGYDNVEVNWISGGGGYPTDEPTINPTTSFSVSGISNWTSFSETAVKNGGEIYYQLSDDGGNTWYYFNAGGTNDWEVAGTGNYNTASVVNANINTFDTAQEQVVFRAFLVSSGLQQIQLDKVSIGCSQSYTWPFDSQSNYSFDDTKIEFSTLGGGETVAQLIYSGDGDSGGTVNPDFSTDVANWTYDDWDQGGGEVDATGTRISSGGNPGGYVNVSFPAGRGDDLGGYWEQSFTTTDTASSASINLDYIISQYQATPEAFQLYVFVDTVPGAPTIGQEVWTSGTISGTSSWTNISSIDITSSLPAAGTYYLKIAVWLETPNNPEHGPYTIGYDNVELNWVSGNAGYPSDGPSVEPSGTLTATLLGEWISFVETASKNGGEIYYKLYDGVNWYWHNGGWVITDSTTLGQYNTALEIDSNIETLTDITSSEDIKFKAFLISDGTQQIQLDNISISWAERGTCSGAFPVCETYIEQADCEADTENSCEWSEGGGSGSYATFGSLTSSAFDTSAASSFNTISWSENLTSCSPACDIQVQIRTAPDSGGSPGAWSAWYGSSGSGSYFTDPAEILLSTDLNFNQWVQYRLELTGDGTQTPVFQDITVNYTP